MPVLYGICPTCTKNAVSAPVLPVSSPKTPVSYTFLPVFCTHTKNWFFPLFWHFYP